MNDVPTNLEDLKAAAGKLGDSGAHHSYVDEIDNAVSELTHLRKVLVAIREAAELGDIDACHELAFQATKRTNS